MNINVVLFDDHSFVTDAIEVFLNNKEGIKILGSYNDKASLFLGLKEFEEIDVLIADVLTDEDIGMEIFEEVKTNLKSTKIIVYSSIKSEFLKANLYSYGVSTILNKKEPIERIYEEILNLAESKSQKLSDQDLPKLTPKEKQIVDFLSKGLASKEIADVTNSSVNTINNQKNALLEKFRCANSTELVVKLSQLGMITIL